jgi:hypothetical protein
LYGHQDFLSNPKASNSGRHIADPPGRAHGKKHYATPLQWFDVGAAKVPQAKPMYSIFILPVFPNGGRV